MIQRNKYYRGIVLEKTELENGCRKYAIAIYQNLIINKLH